MEKFWESDNCLKCKKGSDCFKKLIPSELEFINQNKTQINYKKGEIVCKQGAFASYVLYISDGLMKLYLEGVNNKNINLRILRTSEFIGLSSIYGDNIYNCSAISLRDSTVCLIEKDSLKKLILNNGAFASEIIKSYCENDKYIFDLIKNLGHKQMHGRLADTLLYLTHEKFKQDDIFSFITRKDIAEFGCISTESTVRLLTEFKNDNIIDIEGKEIKVLNKNLLKEISRRG